MKILCSILISIVLLGCANGTLNLSLKPGAKIPAGESIVFGSISVSSDFGTSYINVLDLKTSQVILINEIEERIEKFYWHLPPGEYAVMNFVSRDAWTHTRTVNRLFAKFTVGAVSEAQYIGNIYVDRKGSKSVVQDNYQEAAMAFKTDFPGLLYTPEKRLTIIGVTK
ncbi:MAG: hypothetical protein GY802_11800 [Gammaproteobacteria bacterium]|nr:hypothetical protein [Gammaproteobacteria bacterium]